MLIEEEEVKPGSEVNPDAIEGLFDDEGAIEETELLMFQEDDEDADLLDIAFTDDDGHW